MPHLIAITGGIGSGKSIVSRILSANGYHVYDCDSMAKKIMDNDYNIHLRLNEHIHPECVIDHKINRPLIAKIVFNDTSKLEILNNLVHSAIITDIKHTASLLHGDATLFIETAIPYQSNIDLMVDAIWNVTAPTEMRISRVTARNSCSRQDVLSRIKSQESYIPPRSHERTYNIINDDITPILPRIHELMSMYK